MLRTVIRRFSSTLAVVSAIGVVLIVIVITIDVVLRAVTSHGVAGSAEIMELAMPIVAYLAMGYAQRSGAHVATGIVTDRLPLQLRRIVLTAGLVVLAVFVLWVTWATVEPLVYAFTTGQVRFGLLELLVWPARLAITVGLFAMLLELIVQIVDTSRGRLDAVPSELDNLTDGGVAHV